MNDIKIFLGMIAGLLLCTSVFAQPLKHEFSVYAGAGPSWIGYSSEVGEDRTGLRGLGGVGYSWFPVEQIGLSTGVELGYYTSTLSFDSLKVSYPTTDIDGNRYEFRMITNKYKEKQRSYFLQIPVMVQYQTLHETRKLYIAGGGKVAIHLQTDYETNPSLMRNSGYYANEDYEYTSQAFMDFGTFSNEGKKGKLSIATGFLASLEAGVRWQLPKDFALYTGLYADYGFNLNTNSILFSGYHQKNLSGLFEEKLVPLSVGLKVRFAFGRGEKKKRKNRVSIIEPDSATLPDDVTEEKQVLIGESPKEPVVNTNQEEEPRKEEVKRKPDDNDDEYHAVKEKIQLPVSGYSPSETRLSKAKKKDLDDKVNLFLDLQKKRPELQIVCEGHTDDTGSDDLNIRIGMQRAEAVRTYLIEKGVSAEQITIVSKGKTEPVSTNGSGDDRKKNRRVKLLIQ